MQKKQFNKSKTRNNKSTRTGAKTARSERNYKSNRTKRSDDDGKFNDKAGVDTTQHPAWYTRIPGLAEFIGRIPMNMISNLPLRLSDSTHVATSYSLTDQNSPAGNTALQPNIVTYYKDLVTPLSYTGTDARSLAMYQFTQEFFTKMRRENVSNMPYDPEAVTLMILNMALGFNYVNLAQRTYGILNYYNSLNRAFPIYLAKAMNLNYEDFRDNMPQFQVRLNMLIHRFDAMRLPRGIDLIEKIATQYSNYYIDTVDTRDTIYIPLPGSHGMVENNELGMLTYFIWNNATLNPKYIDWRPKGFSTADGSTATDSRITVDKLMTFIETFVNNLLRSQDFGRIQGDLERAFGSNGYYTLEPMPADYSLAPVYDEMALMQLHNADLISHQVFANTDGNQYYAINPSTGKACGSWCYDQYDWMTSVNRTAAKNFVEISVVNSSDTSHGTWPTNRKDYGINDRYICLNPEQISADNVIEFTRNKGPWGVDTVSDLILWVPMSDSLKSLLSSLGKTPTGYDVIMYQMGSSVSASAHNAQHVGYNISLGATTLSEVVNGSGVFKCTSLDYIDYIQNNGRPNIYMVPDSVRAIVRYLPYQIIRGYYSPTAESTATREIQSTSEFVSTFAPIIQPVTASYLDMLGLNCWMSLLTM